MNRRNFLKGVVILAGGALGFQRKVFGQKAKEGNGWTASYSPAHFPDLSGIITYDELKRTNGGRLDYRDGKLIIPGDIVLSIIRARNDPKIGRFFSDLEQLAKTNEVAAMSLGITETFHLDIIHSFDTGSGIMYDHIVAAGSPNAGVSIDKDNYDALHAPNPPGDYARIHTTRSGFQLGYDVQPFDSVSEMRRTWPIDVIVYEDTFQPLDGQANITINNVNQVPLPYWVIGILHDKNNVPQQRVDLRAQNSINWQAVQAKDKHAMYKVEIIHPIVTADLIEDGTIDFKDFAAFAKNYLKNVPEPSDINADGITNLKDLKEIVSRWLKSYTPGL